MQAPPATVAQEDLAFSEMACGLFSEDDDEDRLHDEDILPAERALLQKRQKRKAKPDSARELHKRLQQQALEAKKELKAQRRDVDNAKKLIQEIEGEEQEQLHHLRRRQVRTATLFPESAKSDVAHRAGQ